MKNKIKLLLEAIGIVSFLILVFMLYLCLTTKVEGVNAVYERQRPIILSDTTNTWPDPDSSFTFDNGKCVAHTYKQKTLNYIEKRF